MNFWREVFSESDGRGSFGRVSFGFVIFAVIVFIGYQVYTRTLASLESWGAFILAVGSATYAVNKFATLKYGDKSAETKQQ